MKKIKDFDKNNTLHFDFKKLSVNIPRKYNSPTKQYLVIPGNLNSRDS